MPKTYWTTEKVESLVSLAKQGCTLAELHKRFPVKSTMSIIFALRASSSLGLSEVQNEAAIEKVRDQRLSKREVFSDSNLAWEDWDCSRLKSYFLQPMSIEDVYLNLGRTYTSIFNQMEKLYPRAMDRQKLYENVAFFVRFKPLKKVIGEEPQAAVAVPEMPAQTGEDGALFVNIESRIIDELESARWNIKVAVAWFTNGAIAKVLDSKLEEGLDVSVILNKDKINCGNGALDFQGMCKHGLSLHWVQNTKDTLMHEKFCIIDNECLIEGTYNWTNKAEQTNDEHVLIVKKDKALIKAFIERFDVLREKYPVLEIEKSQEWMDKNKALQKAYVDYLLKQRQQKEQEEQAPKAKRIVRSSKPTPPADIWKDYYSRPWTIDDEALLLHYFYREELKVSVLSRILKRTDAEIRRRLEELKPEAVMLGLIRLNKKQ